MIKILLFQPVIKILLKLNLSQDWNGSRLGNGDRNGGWSHRGGGSLSPSRQAPWTSSWTTSWTPPQKTLTRYTRHHGHQNRHHCTAQDTNLVKTVSPGWHQVPWPSLGTTKVSKDTLLDQQCWHIVCT